MTISFGKGNVARHYGKLPRDETLQKEFLSKTKLTTFEKTNRRQPKIKP